MKTFNLLLLFSVLYSVLWINCTKGADCKIVEEQLNGTISYSYQYADNAMETCEWIFNGTDSTNLIFALTVLKHYALDKQKDEVFTLPNGIQADIPKSSYSASGIWCQLYANNNGKRLRKCAKKYSHLCDKQLNMSDQWPPRMTTTVYFLKLELTYQFLECSDDVVTTTVQYVGESSTTTSSSLTTSMTSISTTTKSAGISVFATWKSNFVLTAMAVLTTLRV